MNMKVIITLLVLSFYFIPIVEANATTTILDNSGQVVNFDQPFTRIISLYSAHTENLCRMGATDQLIGISSSDDYPLSVLEKKRYSYREDPEKFIAARPDLVLVRPMIARSYPQFIKKLNQAGIRVISLQPGSIEELFDYWKTLGLLAGKTHEAKEMTASFKKGIAGIAEKLKNVPDELRPKVYFESIHSKMKTFSATGIAMYVLEQAGGINIATDAIQVRKTNIAAYGKERILSNASEIDIFLAQKGRMNPVTIQTIVNEPGFKAIKAVEQGRVYLIEEPLVSRPTFRILEGVEKLNTIFFSEN